MVGIGVMVCGVFFSGLREWIDCDDRGILEYCYYVVFCFLMLFDVFLWC